MTADKDAFGNTISGSKKMKVLAYINSMLLTVEQKDALYRLAGYAESTLSDAPWHGGAKYAGTTAEYAFPQPNAGLQPLVPELGRFGE